MKNYCVDRLISLRAQSEMLEVMLREVALNSLVAGHAVGNDANPGSRGPQ